MAFTEQEEAKVRAMLSAFENGKRLSDLPDVSVAANPFNLTTEVLEAGESKKASLATLLPYTKEQCAYGVEKDFSVSSTTWTRIGNMSLHKSLPIQSRMRGCLLDDDGNVVEYLPENNWEGMVRDGSRGQVMVEIPSHWECYETAGTVLRAWRSEFPIPGFMYVPTMYISAYEATVDRTVSATPKLSSVVNKAAAFRGGNNTASWDTDENKSLLGRPATNISRTSFRTYARNRKADNTSWNCYLYLAHQTLFWLYVIEYANGNSQLAYNAQLTAEGYHQGGLGAGVTTLDGGKWNTFNGYNPFVPCGHTDSLGNRTGVVDYVIQGGYNTTPVTVSVPRYRGIENPFGHVWKWTDGCNIRISANTANGGDGLSKVFICNDLSKLNDSNYTGYSHVGNIPRTEAFVKSLIFGVTGCMLPAEVGGGDTTYIGDYFYTNIPASGEQLRGLLLGGSAGHGSNAGLAFAYSDSVPSNAAASFGSRLCYVKAA